MNPTLRLILLLTLACWILPGWLTAQEAGISGSGATAAAEAVESGGPSEIDHTEESSCITCHEGIGGIHRDIVDQFRDSIHGELDFGCHDCHGGDPQGVTIYEAMDPELGFIGRPDRASIPLFCDRCHGDSDLMKQYGNLRTDQLELYKTSTHGAALFTEGDTNVAICSDCHSAHNILKVANPNSSVHKKNLPATCGVCHSDSDLMAGYQLDPGIPDQYVNSAHGRQLFEFDDLGAPVCNNCHGNHGATPPGVDAIGNVCGTCHLKTEQYYNNSKHATAFEELGLGKCLVCHHQHALEKPTDNYFAADTEATCVQCHSEGTTEYVRIAAMYQTIIDIREMHETADRLVEDTERTTHLSMFEMIPRVEQIRTYLLTARILQHSTNVTDMEENLGTATEAFAEIEAFTEKLLERSKFNKRIVVFLALALFCYGIFVVIYKNYVLDVHIPWETYEGPALDDANQE